MTGSDKSCDYRGCRNRRNATEAPATLSNCGRCKYQKYCSRNCQKKDWKFHKHTCLSADVPRHQVEDCTEEAIKSAIAAAAPGDAVLLPVEGTFDGDHFEITIDKPLHIIGPSAKKENCKFECKHLTIKVDVDGGNVVLANFMVNASVSVNVVNQSSGSSGSSRYDDEGNKIKKDRIVLSNVTVQCRAETQDAFCISGCHKHDALLIDCEIYGGADGLFIQDCGYNAVHLKSTDVRFAGSRGIFARQSFVIEDCEVSNCGAYGIKGSAGWEEKGDNDIQAGPWGQYGGAAGGMGFY